MILGIALVALGGILPVTVALVTFILPESFASTARFVPAATQPAAFAMELEKLQSRAVLYQVISNLNLTKIWAQKFKLDDLPTDLAFGLLKRTVTVRRAGDANIIDVTVLSEDKNEAANIANQIVQVYRRSTPVKPDGSVGIQVLDPATPSLRPARPNKALNIVCGLGVGALVAIVGVVLIVLATKQSKEQSAISG